MEIEGGWSAVTSQNILEIISSQYFQLTNSEKRVADYVLSHQRDVEHLSISEFAQVCNVADATISRFCRRLGASGYNAFKLEVAKAAMASASGHSSEQDVEQEEGQFGGLCRRLIGEHVSALEQTAQFLDEESVSRALELMEQAQRVNCMGQGASMVMAQEAWTLFSTLSPKYAFVPDSHLQVHTVALMEPGDVVLFFSYSGSTRDLKDVLEVAKGRGVKVILVSRFPKSPCGQMADVVLQCGANESPLQAGSATARIAQLFVLEVLFQQMREGNAGRAEAARDRIAEAVSKKHL